MDLTSEQFDKNIIINIIIIDQQILNEEKNK
jgi:hypothetical protein